MNIKPGLDDQSISYKIYYDYPEVFSPDYNHNLFSNSWNRWNSLMNFQIQKESELCLFNFENNK